MFDGGDVGTHLGRGELAEQVQRGLLPLGCHPRRSPLSRLGQADQSGPPICGMWLATDQPGGFQRINEASDVAGRAMAWPWLASRDIHIVLSGADVAAGVAGVLAALALWGVVGVGLAALIREQVATVVGLLIYLFVVETILTNAGALDPVTKDLPGQANEAIAGSTLTNQDFLDPWQGGLVLAGYGLVLAFAGTLLSARRDVT